jgi:hypothetical protein
MSDHSGCAQRLRDGWAQAAAEDGGAPIEVTISTAAPLVRNRFTEAFRCPHGVTFYMEPTGDAIASMAAADRARGEAGQ